MHIKWLKSYLRFPVQLQPVVDWLRYQAEAVCAKTVCWGVVLKLFLLYSYIFPLHFFVGQGLLVHLTHDLG